MSEPCVAIIVVWITRLRAAGHVDITTDALFLPECSHRSACITHLCAPAAQTDPPDLEKSAAMFEQVGSDCLSSNLMKFSAKGNFFNAVICTLARGDIVAAEGSLNKYKDMDYTFGGGYCFDILLPCSDRETVQSTCRRTLQHNPSVSTIGDSDH